MRDTTNAKYYADLFLKNHHIFRLPIQASIHACLGLVNFLNNINRFVM